MDCVTATYTGPYSYSNPDVATIVSETSAAIAECLYNSVLNAKAGDIAAQKRGERKANVVRQISFALTNTHCLDAQKRDALVYYLERLSPQALCTTTSPTTSFQL